MTRDTRALDAHLAAYCEKKLLPGVSVAMWGPEGEVFAKGYGRANADGSRSVDADTLFGIASMSKSQVALCCAILETEGKLSFHDPVCKYFPAFTLPGTPRDAVQLRHLATHTAGIPPIEPLEWSIAMHSNERTDAWTQTMRQTAPNPFDTIEQIIDYIATCGYPMLGAPGEYMSYCNEGYALLSYVVDQAAGMPLEAFLQARIYGPLGMTRTVLDVDGKEAAALSGGNITSLFEREDGRLSCDDEWSILPPYRGCGLVKSTARDMAAYYRCLANQGMHEGRQAIPREAVALLIGKGFPTQREPVYAYGLYKRSFGAHTICEHSGGLHGVSSHGGLLLDEGWGFAALCNQGDMDVEPLVWAMYNWVLGLPLDTSHRWYAPVDRPFADPQMVLGTFRCHEGVPVDVTVFDRDGALHVRKGDRELPLAYCGDTLFAAFEADGSLFLRIRVYVREGRAWAALCGSRMYQRVEEVLS